MFKEFNEKYKEAGRGITIHPPTWVQPILDIHSEMKGASANWGPSGLVKLTSKPLKEKVSKKSSKAKKD